MTPSGAHEGHTGPVRAVDVTVAHIYQARCQRPGCQWASDLFSSHSEAASERKWHLNVHRRHLAGDDVDPGEFEPVAGSDPA